MKIEVKYNIDFKKLLKLVEENKLTKFTNNKLAPQTAKLAQKYIRSGKVKDPLKPITLKQREKYFGVTHKKPLFMTGKLHDSLKGGTQGISAVSYAKEHREPGGYVWDKPSKPKGYKVKDKPDVPQREFIPHYEDSAKGNRVIALKGTGGDLKKMYKAFQDKFIKLLNKRLRKR